jgi:endoglucanase
MDDLMQTTTVSTSSLPVDQQTAAGWKGFNLTNKLVAPKDRPSPPFCEADFDLIAEWGFTFVRLPVSYRCWTSPEDWQRVDDSQVQHVVDAVKWCAARGLHADVGFHRIPGFSVHKGVVEPFDLFKDAEALDAARYQWRMLAECLYDYDGATLTFNLFNEPGGVDTATYLRIVDELTAVIREVSPDRPIIADGLGYGHEAVPELGERGLIHSGRGYMPHELTHYNAPFWTPDQKRLPQWPLIKDDGTVLGNDYLEAFYATWSSCSRRGEPVHIGEFGCYRTTPHRVMLAWMHDLLDLYARHGFGWALWGLHGDFGVINSKRDDVAYESFRGHQLDRALLDLLQSHLQQARQS